MGEFGTAFAFAAIAATLFLGGYGVPFMTLTDGPIDNLIGIGALFIKIMIVAFFIFWIRFTYPRFREDQLQILAWKYLIPISLVNIMVTATFKVVF
jgi:NADH-quinone oxidoreductase subunit H